MNGIDVSNWQNGLVPSHLDIDFCICKATEGIGYTDSSCDGFVQNCIENDILWGFYHFARENQPEAEAEYFFNECKNYFGYGIPVLDYETTNYDNVDWCERFVKRLHDISGVWCMLYTSASWCGQFENSWLPEKCGLWVAGYPYVMDDFSQAGNMPYNIYPWSFAAIWQFTSSLYIDGYSGALDGNVAYMDKEAWLKYANANSNEPQQTDTAKSVDNLVNDVLNGVYGIGQQRIDALGPKYDDVQNRINELYSIADDVIAGKWGNGWNREQSLNGAGFPYDIVQRIVNDKLS